MPALSERSTCWVVTDGKIGMESQCLGLAQALGLDPVVKRIALRAPWRQLSPHLRLGLAHAFSDRGDPVAPPWPDVLIASGRQSVPASLLARAAARKAGRRTITIQIQNAGIDPKNFDFVVTPMHDQLDGRNVLITLGALHRVALEMLKAEAAKLTARVSGLSPPYVGVLIGGANGAYAFSASDMRAFASALLAFAETMQARLLVTPSRRTGDENMKILRETLGRAPAFIWDGEGDNPYYGILGLADCLIVTCDSVNMITEACASGRPVYVYDLPGGSKKFERFHRAIREQGYVHRFTGAPTLESVKRLDEMSDVAREIKARIAAIR